nr:MAG TPA: hypothetical protein [Caudoviricetes sp.]
MPSRGFRALVPPSPICQDVAGCSIASGARVAHPVE